MNTPNRRLGVILSVIGLVCVVLSLALNFIAPGTWWNWALLLVALGFLLLSRRYHQNTLVTVDPSKQHDLRPSGRIFDILARSLSQGGPLAAMFRRHDDPLLHWTRASRGIEEVRAWQCQRLGVGWRPQLEDHRVLIEAGEGFAAGLETRHPKHLCKSDTCGQRQLGGNGIIHHAVMNIGDMQHIFEFEAVPDGTRLTQTLLVEPMGIGKLLAPIMPVMLRRRLRTINLEIRDYVTRPARSSAQQEQKPYRSGGHRSRCKSQTGIADGQAFISV